MRKFLMFIYCVVILTSCSSNTSVDVAPPIRQFANGQTIIPFETGITKVFVESAVYIIKDHAYESEIFCNTTYYWNTNPKNDYAVFATKSEWVYMVYYYVWGNSKWYVNVTESELSAGHLTGFIIPK